MSCVGILGFVTIFLFNNAGSLPRFELPTNPQELQTIESLGIVLRNAQRLLSDYAISSLPVSVIYICLLFFGLIIVG